jgi:tetratricopeptide (TPR) repeat protein
MKRWIPLLGAAAAIALLPELGATSPAPSRLAPYRFSIAPAAAAEIDFLKARVDRDPLGALDRAALAGALLGQGKIEEAEALAREAEASRPGTGRLVLGRVALARHDFHEALRLAEGPLLVTARLGLGDLIGASKAADALVDARPTWEHLALRALVLSARGRTREAEEDWRQAVAVEEPGDPDGSAWMRAMWARHLLSRGRRDDAEDLVREALRVRPGHPAALGVRADLFGGSKEPSPGHVLADARRLLETRPAEALALLEAEGGRRRPPELLLLLSRARLAVGRPREAREAVREAWRSGADSPELQRQAAACETALGSPSRAAMHLELAR